MAVQASRRQPPGWDSRRNSGSSSSGRRGTSGDQGMFRFKYNQVDIGLAEDQLWQLAVPFAVLFGLAIFIGA